MIGATTLGSTIIHPVAGLILVVASACTAWVSIRARRRLPASPQTLLAGEDVTAEQLADIAAHGARFDAVLAVCNPAADRQVVEAFFARPDLTNKMLTWIAADQTAPLEARVFAGLMVQQQRE